MKIILKRLENYILNSTTWLFASVIALMTILMIQESITQNWSVYFSFLFAFTVLSLPVLVFSILRTWLETHVNSLLFKLIWSGCFIGFPILIHLTKAYSFFHFIFQQHRGMTDISVGMMAVYSVLSILLLLTEVVILSNHYLLERSNLKQWIKKISLEKTILISIFVFSMFVVGSIYSLQTGGKSPWQNLPNYINYSFQFFIMLALYYCFYWVNHYILINRILKEKGIFYYAFAFIGVLFFFYPVISQLIYYLPIVDHWKIHPVNGNHVFIGINLITPMIGMLLSIPFILAFQWFKQRSAIAILEKEKSATELNLLKQQINPHFFFNTLNNLYALSLRQDKQTPEVILQLSDLMRYVIYKGKESRVTLAEDVAYIEDYIELQQIRLHKNLDLKFVKDIQDPNILIPPLLFIILVENAFKHGIEPAEKDCFLHVYLKSDDEGWLFTCENSYEIEDTIKENGIGLDNLKRRLELHYGPNFEIIIDKKADSFRITIQVSHQ